MAACHRRGSRGAECLSDGPEARASAAASARGCGPCGRVSPAGEEGGGSRRRAASSASSLSPSGDALRDGLVRTQRGPGGAVEARGGGRGRSGRLRGGDCGLSSPAEPPGLPASPACEDARTPSSRRRAAPGSQDACGESSSAGSSPVQCPLPERVKLRGRNTVTHSLPRRTQGWAWKRLTVVPNCSFPSVMSGRCRQPRRARPGLRRGLPCAFALWMPSFSGRRDP